MSAAQCSRILRDMRALANPANLEGMARFGIDPSSAIGLGTPAIRAIARSICKDQGKDQALAEELWQTGIREARVLATLVADPRLITRSAADRWVRDLTSWDVCDACSCELFDRTPFVWQKIPKWAANPREFVRRAAFSTLAGAAVHLKTAEDQRFLDGLALVEQYAFDDRNFVRTAVNWALRNIGKRNARLLPAAVACAQRIRAQNSRASRWIAADALREFRLKYGPV
jgi:3-methyladenine DNA glycosylase AlkD